MKDYQRLVEENSKLKSALEEIAMGGLFIDQAMGVAERALSATKCAVPADSGKFQSAMAGMKL